MARVVYVHTRERGVWCGGVKIGSRGVFLVHLRIAVAVAQWKGFYIYILLPVPVPPYFFYISSVVVVVISSRQRRYGLGRAL